MFIEGIAGIENTAFTSPSVSGEPSACLTVTTKRFSPLFGGLGSLANAMSIPPVAGPVAEIPAPPDAAGAFCGPLHAAAKTASATTITLGRLKPAPTYLTDTTDFTTPPSPRRAARRRP